MIKSPPRLTNRTKGQSVSQSSPVKSKTSKSSQTFLPSRTLHESSTNSHLPSKLSLRTIRFVVFPSTTSFRLVTAAAVTFRNGDVASGNGTATGLSETWLLRRLDFDTLIFLLRVFRIVTLGLRGVSTGEKSRILFTLVSPSCGVSSSRSTT